MRFLFLLFLSSCMSSSDAEDLKSPCVAIEEADSVAVPCVRRKVNNHWLS
jgi:hypothetical protein